ncbi:hypothetical protein BXZ70DRAFT_915826 [Cristinia sonorae]|uniref:ferric-chelate reductase (NADPH) n=1 Tax=Cristinia sonorae TaxID=1940300 RepID=A0A8K0UZW6_9AGAR|nr:hypothetical protein BXZ70DRAFT_915826 [Cristinia sonorae]
MPLGLRSAQLIPRAPTGRHQQRQRRIAQKYFTPKARREICFLTSLFDPSHVNDLQSSPATDLRSLKCAYDCPVIADSLGYVFEDSGTRRSWLYSSTVLAALLSTTTRPRPHGRRRRVADPQTVPQRIMQARATASATKPLLPNPTTPIYGSDSQWIAAYLTIHSLSDASRVYSYLLWITIGVVMIVFSIVRAIGLRNGYIGAVWSKWSLRRRTWRKKHSLAIAAKQSKPYTPPMALPSNAQILTLTVIIIGSLALSYVGPDYFAPDSYPWNVGKTPTAPVFKRGTFDTFYPDNFLQFRPRYTIVKAWWTSAARTGQIAYALLPFCILLSLKAPPIAVFSISFLTNIHFDKLAWLHRWCGILIWFITTLHVGSWSVQLFRDRRRGTDKIAYKYAWQYLNFVFGWTAYALLTLVILGSLPPIRRHYYEIFYVLHVIFVPSMLIMAAFHHPPLWWWCWVALGLWVAERLYRFLWFLYTNGFFGTSQPKTKTRNRDSNGTKSNKLVKRPSQKSVKSVKAPPPQSFPMHTLELNTSMDYRASKMFQYPTASSVHEVASHARAYSPPPGFVHAELQSGSTVRLRLVTPEFLSWAPGQHFLITVPSVSRFTSHPFTTASVCDESSKSNSGRELVFLIRAKKGWTKDLRDTVTSLLQHGRKHPAGERLPPDTKLPEHGVLMHGLVDGPFGSAARANWGAYSTVLIVAGGSGVSFGMSILEFLTLCLSGRDGKELGSRSGGWGMPGFKTTRVRFIWLVREFAHLQWCASALRRCMALVPSSELQIDIYVTNAKPNPRKSMYRASMRLERLQTEEDEFAPPEPQFVREGQTMSPRSSSDNASRYTRPLSSMSTDSEESAGSDVDLSYYAGDFLEEEHGAMGHEEHVLDYTNFDGDDESILPGEEVLNYSVRKEGKRRRSYVRRASMAIHSKDFEFRNSGYSGYSAAFSTRSGVPVPAASASAVRLVAPSKSIAQLGAVTENIQESQLLSPSSPYSAIDTPGASSAATLLPQHPFPPSPLHMSTTAPESPRTSMTQLPTPSSPQTRDRRLSQASAMSSWSNHSLAALVQGADIRLELNEVELADISVVAERARPGKPKLDRILADEVERSKGAVVVGCCGPTSLNAMMRKYIAAQINPERIRRGDMRGSIALVAEDFEY